MKRLLIVTSYYPEHGGGIETVTAELAHRWIEQGFFVCWVASDEPGLTESPPVPRLPMTAWNFSERAWGIPYPLWSISSLSRLICEIGHCDLVHLHDSVCVGSLITAFACWVFRKPLVITQHTGMIRYRSWLPRALITIANNIVASVVLRVSHRTVFVSEPVMHYFKHRVRFPVPPILIPNGVDHEQFQFVAGEQKLELRKRLQLPQEQPLILFVGRFVEKKGMHLLRRLAANFTECWWLFVGWGAEDPGCWGLPNVICRGAVPHTKISIYYQAADLLVLPSFGEGFPLVVQEAMACGTPVLISEETAAAIPGIENIAFVSALCFESFSEAVRRIVQSTSLLQSRREASVNFARQYWDWNICSDQYLQLFAEEWQQISAHRLNM